MARGNGNRTLGWLWLSVLLAGCPKEQPQEPDAGPVEVGPEQLTEQEPDDRPEQALALTRDAVVSANLKADAARQDEDWYRLAPSVPRVADITVSGIPGGDVILEVYEAPSVRSAGVNAEGEGKPERYPNLYVERERWVRVASARKGTGGAYTLTVSYRAPSDGEERETNDRAVDATMLPLGQTVAAYLGHSGDEDWYRVELPAPPPPESEPTDSAPPEQAPQAPEGSQATPPADAPEATPPTPTPSEEGTGLPPTGLPLGLPEELKQATEGLARNGPPDAGTPAPVPEEPQAMALKLELSAIDGVRPELEVLSAAEAALFSAKGKEGEGLSLRNVGVRASDQVVYVVVKGGWMGTGKDAKRGYNATMPYTLTVSLEEAGVHAELEPNDEPFKATPLVPSLGYKEGFLSPKGDQDYFVLRTAEPVLARVELSGVERVDVVLSAVEPPEGEGQKETVVLRANEGGVKEPERLNSVACGGTCYFRVEGASRKVDGKWVRDYENAEMPYRLTVTTVPDNGSEEREPNDTVARAMDIALGRPVRGTVYPRKDVDYFRLDLSDRPVRTPLRATLLGILKVDVGLYLHRVGPDGKLTLVQTSDRAKGEQPEVIRYSAEPDVYIFEVRDARNREANFQDSWQLTVDEGE